MTKLRRADAVRLLRGLWYHGVHSHKVRTRGENGVFAADSDVPVTPTACIIGSDEVATIRKRARACLRFVPLKSPVVTGEPPFSRFLDIWQDGTIYNSALYTLLLPVFPSIRALVMQVARIPEDVPEIPSSVFVSMYPQGYQSGMRVHRDSMVAYGAVTMVVTNDAVDGQLYAQSGVGVRYPIPLAEGWAVGMHPDTWHGVEEVMRSADRISITFFF